MKKRLLILWVAIVCMVSGISKAHAQAVKLPPFAMRQTDGKVFRAHQLPMGRPIILMYFSPECDHCQTMMQAYFKRANDFKKASVAMITFLPLDKVAAFEKKYGVKKYNNIYLGTEGTTFFIRKYYNLMEMPFVALYDKGGNLVKTYIKNPNLNDLFIQLNGLK